MNTEIMLETVKRLKQSRKKLTKSICKYMINIYQQLFKLIKFQLYKYHLIYAEKFDNLHFFAMNFTFEKKKSMILSRDIIFGSFKVKKETQNSSYRFLSIETNIHSNSQISSESKLSI